MQATTRKSVYVATLLTALIATAWLAPVTDSSVAPQAARTTPAPLVGVATGEFANGIPVYRLPTITVAVKRSVELARIEQEDAAARAASSAVVVARQADGHPASPR